MTYQDWKKKYLAGRRIIIGNPVLSANEKDALLFKLINNLQKHFAV